MSRGPERRFSDAELDWVAEHLDEVVAYSRGERALRWPLLATLLLGLGVHLLGYAFATGAFGLPTTWPADLVADLLVSFGTALWTSVAIVVFLEVWPSQRRREVARFSRDALAALKARGDKLPVEVPPADQDIGPDAKLDAILARLTALEEAVRRS